jgi:hypothetical protein
MAAREKTAVRSATIPEVDGCRKSPTITPLAAWTSTVDRGVACVATYRITIEQTPANPIKSHVSLLAKIAGQPAFTAVIRTR